MVVEDFQQQARVRRLGPAVEKKKKLLMGWRKKMEKKWDCDLVSALGNRFWELGDCLLGFLE